MKKYTLTMLLLSFLAKEAICQSFDPPNIKTSLAPVAGSGTPRASTVEAFEGVNYFTGQANINIPVYSKEYGSVSVNVGIGYSSSGIPLLQFPSEIGSGWSLSTGFSLTREINGNADDDLDQGNLYPMDTTAEAFKPAECKQRVKGFLRDASPVPLSPQSSGAEIRNYYISNQDPEQDIFTCTLNGQSVKFVIGKNSEIFTLSPSDWKIEYSYNSNISAGARPVVAGSIINKFTVTDEKGNKYFFEVLGYSSTCAFIFCNNEGACPTLYSNATSRGVWNPVTDWQITKIVTYNGQEIAFNYLNKNGADNLGEIYYSATPAFRSVTNTTNEYCYRYPDSYEPNSSQYTMNFKPYLESIVMSDGVSLKFVYGSESRKEASYDPSTFERSFPLKEIRLQRYGYPTTYYSFYQSYFDASNTNGFIPYSNNGLPYYGNFTHLRLKLDSILVTPDDQNRGYRFDYDLTKRLPRRSLPDVDHWGFYNGALNRGLLQIDLQRGAVNTPVNDRTPYEGSRESNAATVTANMLRKITFGDNSSVQYEFEANEGRYYNFFSGLESGGTIGGGARIKSITTYDGIDHANDIKKRLEYKLDNGTTSGILFSKPVYAKDFDCVTHGMTLISTTNSLVSSYGFTKNGSPIGYSQVTVLNGLSGEGGKETYYYSNLVDGNQINIIAGRTPSVPYTNKQFLQDWSIGLLKGKKTYAASGALVAEDTYEYATGSKMPVGGAKPYFKNLHYEIKRGDPRGLTNKTCQLNIPWDFYKEEYYPVQGWATISKMTTTDYRSSVPVATTIEYTYDNKLNLKKELTKGSDGTYLEKRYYRVYDYDVVPGNVAFDYLVLGNRSSELVREDRLTKENISAPFKYLSSTIKSFSAVYLDPANKIFRVEPGSIYKLASDQPLNESVLGASNNPAQSVPTNSGYYYKDMNLFYNTLGLLTEINKNGHVNSALYDNYDVIAQAEYAASGDIAYTSFENNADAQGGWLLETIDQVNDGYSGNHSAATIRNPIICQKPLQPSRTYNINMWAKTGIPVLQFNTGPDLTLTSSGETTAGGWIYYYGSFTGKTNIRIASGAQVDEVRLYPKGATMKTFTYQPLSGLLSECNEQSNVINYTYDFLGRLIEISDKDHKIIKQYRYGVGTQN